MNTFDEVHACDQCMDWILRQVGKKQDVFTAKYTVRTLNGMVSITRPAQVEHGGRFPR